MTCAYTQGLDRNDVRVEAAEALPSRAAGILAGVGKSTVNKHRPGELRELAAQWLERFDDHLASEEPDETPGSVGS